MEEFRSFQKSITTPSSTSDEKLEKSVNNLQSPQSQESVGASNEITESEDSAAKKSDKTETCTIFPGFFLLHNFFAPLPSYKFLI